MRSLRLVQHGLTRGHRYNFEDFFTAVVYHYNNFNPARPPGAQYSMDGMLATDFPHLSTVLLQSMKLDVSSSLVGLGYLIGKTELEPALQGLYGDRALPGR
jgi:hypothetical protein